jgi:hypothetical protein
MLTLSLIHKKPFSCELHINNKKRNASKNLTKHFFKIAEDICNIKIFINPYKIKPLIRINSQLVNYGLAEITPYNHVIEFQYSRNFLDKYFKNIIKSKMNYLNLKNSTSFGYENNIGVGNMHSNLIEKIEKNLK